MCRKIFFSGPSVSKQKIPVMIFLRRNLLGGVLCHLVRKKQPLLLRNVSESYSYSSHFKALKIIPQEFLLKSQFHRSSLVTNQSVVQTVVYSEMIIWLDLYIYRQIFVGYNFSLLQNENLAWASRLTSSAVQFCLLSSVGQNFLFVFSLIPESFGYIYQFGYIP